MQQTFVPYYFEIGPEFYVILLENISVYLICFGHHELIGRMIYLPTEFGVLINLRTPDMLKVFTVYDMSIALFYKTLVLYT